MANDKNPKDKENLKPDGKNIRIADQAEGERDNKTSTKVTRTPDQAEGERETVEEDIRNKEREGKL